MKSRSNSSEGSMRLLIPFDTLKDCCNKNVNWPHSKFFPSSLEVDIDLIRRLLVCQVLAGVYLNKDFLYQILITSILQNGIRVSPLVWEFVRKSSISQKHPTTRADNHEKIPVKDSKTPGETYEDPLTKRFKNNRMMNFLISETLINLKQPLKEIKVSENNERKLRLKMLIIIFFADTMNDIFRCKENKWYKDLFSCEMIDFLRQFLIFPGTINQSFDKLSQGTPPDDFEIMKFEFHRLSSFSNYTFPDVPSAIFLAKAGWFATGSERETKTFCCLKVYSKWNRKDDPHYIHKMLSPTCFFISGGDIGQVPFHNRTLNDNYEASVDNARSNGCLPGSKLEQISNTSEEILYERTDHMESMIDETGQPDTKVCNEEMSECDNELFAQNNENSEIHSTNNASNLDWNISDALYPNQSELETRIESFSMVNKSHYALKIGPGSENYVIANKTAEEFARAGLFYRGFRDRTSCFYCGIGLQHWTSVDDIIQRHYQSSENCPIAQASLQGIITDRNTSTAENGVVVPQNQTRECTRSLDTEAIIAELNEMGFDQELIKAAIESLRHRGLEYTKERVVNEILDNRAFLQSLPSNSGAAEYDPSNFQESEEALESPSIETTSGENAGKTIAPSEIIERTASTSNFKEQSDDELRLRVTCKVCLSEEVGVLFLPCSHLVSCISCSRRLKKCPLCRKHIQTKQPMYW